jgi:putative DNA methylase
VYMPATNEQEDVARSAKPDWEPEGGFVQDSRAFTPWLYGMSNWRDLFTNRQLVALTTFSELISEARQRVLRDTDSIDGDTRDADDYANAVALYLSLGVSRLADIQNALCAWENSKTQVRHLFTRQAIPMLWDYGENGLFSGAAGDFGISLKSIVRCMERWTLELPQGTAEQADAQIQSVDCGCVISTDPPYYDNIGYADLSDFFYVWLRKSLRHIYPDVFSTVTTPKAEELISAPYRHGGRMEAEQFFLHGMKNAVARMLHNSHALIPVTIYYAFKQSEKAQDGLTSTGWATFLEAVISSGFSITGTWPMRSELANRMRGLNSNALASSVVIVCRPRSSDAPSAPRRDFLRELRKRLPGAVEKLQHANIAPVDLAQAALGPGMAVFSEYSSVVEPEGGEMSVREALRVINNVLAETLEGQETDFDSDTRWAVAWFKQNGFAQGEYGMAEELARAQAVSVDGLKNGGIVKSGSGKARLVRLEELPENWDPTTDDRVSIWECTSHLAQSLKEAGEAGCAMVLRQVRQKSATLPEASRELAYLLFQVCEKNGWTAEALAYNALVVAWPSIENQADALAPEPEQAMLL